MQNRHIQAHRFFPQCTIANKHFLSCANSLHLRKNRFRYLQKYPLILFFYINSSEGLILKHMIKQIP